VPLFHAVFEIDWTTVGGSSFIELASGVNLAFIAWDTFQQRLKFVDRDCRAMVNQACADIIDEQHRKNSEEHFARMLNYVDASFKGLWWTCYFFGVLTVLLGFAMLYFNWNCRHDYLLLLPILVYLFVSLLIWSFFRWRCKSHCKALSIAQGSPSITDTQEVNKMTKGLEEGLKSQMESKEIPKDPKASTPPPKNPNPAPKNRHRGPR
jgi:hypothetical protein